MELGRDENSIHHFLTESHLGDFTGVKAGVYWLKPTSYQAVYDQRELALETARDARDLLEKCKDPLPICVRGGTYSTLSVMQARNYQSPDMARKKASEQGPDSEVQYLLSSFANSFCCECSIDLFQCDTYTKWLDHANTMDLEV